MRRFYSRTVLITFMVLLLAANVPARTAAAQLPTDPLTQEANRRQRLEAVDHWFYFLSFDLADDQDIFHQVINSSYDMVVMEAIFTEKNSTDEEGDVKTLIAKMHNAPHPKLVIAYIDIGQAEDFRSYWKAGWKVGNPEWIVGEDPDGWEGNYPVAYWYDDWRAIWLGKDGYLQTIINVGFDGVYLDWVEAYSDDNVAAKARSENLNARQEMIWWVEDIATFTQAQVPDFLVIGQNAAELGVSSPYLAAIDAIAQEQVWFDGAADNVPPGDCPLPATDADIDTNAYERKLKQAGADCYQMYLDFPESTLHVSSEEYIKALQVAHDKGEKIFTVDYALQCSNVAWVYARARQLGFTPFASERFLSIYRHPTWVCAAYLPLIADR